jgi:uncharacterized protein (TIGR00369 family)
MPTRTIHWEEPADLRRYAALSGLELLRLALKEERNSPIAALMDFRLLRFDEGRALLEGTPGAFHYNPMRQVHGGFAATLLDAAMACAVHTTLQPGFGYTTLELKVNYVRAMTAATGAVTCEAGVVHRGRQIVTAEGKLSDAQGKLYAHGTTTCMVLDTTR